MTRDGCLRRRARDPDFVTELGDHSPVLVRSWLGDDRIVVEVIRRNASRAHRRVLLRLRGKPAIAGAWYGWNQWTMVAGLPPSRAARRDPFQSLLQETAPLVLAGLPAGRSATARDRAAARRWGRRIREVFRELAVMATTRCDAAARAIALRFSPCMRWWLYGELVRDDSGRLAQLACACPGALVFAFALHQQHAFDPACDRMLADARLGVPLPRLLDAAVEHWRASAWSFVAEQGPSAGAAWSRFFSATGPDLERVCRQQRLLVRRAGPRVAPSFLLTPPPLAFVPEDIPSGARRNAHWYRAMKGSAATLAEGGRSGPDSRAAAAALVSRWAGELPGNGKRPSLSRVRALVDYCVETRRVPHRRTDPGRLMADARAWSRVVGKIARAHAPTYALPAAVLDLAIPDVERFAWDTQDTRIVPLHTVRDVYGEANAMHHCVASFIRSALAGECVLLHATVGAEELTLQIERRPDGLVLVQVAGIANERASNDALRRLDAWMQVHGIADGLDARRR